MKKLVVVGIVFSILLAPVTSRGDMFGGDVAVLTQILANAIQQLSQLQTILGTGKDTLNLMREVYRGISDALNLLRTINPNADPGIYRDWETVAEAMRRLEEIYGPVADSSDARAQRDADQSAAEAIHLNNDLYKYSQQIDEIGEQVKAASHTANPVGAQKLTAQTLGVMLHVMNAALRAHATGIKLQAQSLAIQNKKEKAMTAHFLTDSNLLRADLNKKKQFFQILRFQ